MNDDLTTREDLADRLMDLALTEKAGGKSPPDLSEQILARAAAQVSLPETRRSERTKSRYGSVVPVGVSLCLLALAAVAAVLWQPDIAPRLAATSRDGELLRMYESELAQLLAEEDHTGALLKAFEEEEAKFLSSGNDVQAMIVGKIRSEIEDGMKAARKKTGSSPETAKGDLKLMLENVERATNLDKDIRDHLRDQLEGAIKEASRREVEEFERRGNNGEARAAALERNLSDETRVQMLFSSSGAPPVVYYDESVWNDLTFKRKKYASIDSGVVRRSVNGVPYTSTKSTTGRFVFGVGVNSDAGVTGRISSDDKLHGVKTNLTERRDELAVEVSKYKKLLDARGIKVEDATDSMTPNVRGEITAVAKNGRLVEISLGTDDGLRVGHTLSAVPTDGIVLLGGIRVLKTSPDRAVAEVLVASAAPIAKGAKVTGKLFDLPPEPDAVPEPFPPAEPEPSGDKFDLLPENDFEKAKETPLSTFSIDVDTASYSKVRQILRAANQLPPAEAVRLEELVNYFPYDYAPPQDEKPFAAHVETAACPWNAEHRLVRIGLKGQVIEAAKRPPCNLVFLVDTSGSMDQPNKLPLVTHGLKMLAGELTERDTVAIVVYAGAAGLVLPPTRGDAKPTIYTALSELKAGGSTNGGEGIELAYKTCQENFLDGGVNRVILCTDGDFNVGLTSTGQLVDLAKEKAQKGVFLSALGFGMGNHNDEMLEAVSNKANGNHAFIDSLSEARKVLVEQIGGTLVTIAKDVKIQVEFEAAAVESYRLLGYENRLLASEDFADDKKDAGEIGAGHTVTALYEIVPAKAERKKGVTPTRSVSEEKLLTLKLRYKAPDGDKSALLEFPVKDSGRRFAEATPDFQFAASVASFGMLLRKSKHAGDSNFAAVAEIAAAAKGTDPHGYRAEFVELVKKAGELAK